jgi:hypothetical protein
MTPSQSMRDHAVRAGFTCRPYDGGQGWHGWRAGTVLLALDTCEFSLYRADPLRLLSQGRGLNALCSVLVALDLPVLPAARRRALLDPPSGRFVLPHREPAL